LSNSGGTSTLVNSTVSGNTATANGGGVASGGGTRFRNVTITANTAGDDGGGVLHTSDSGSISFRNTIVAGNTDTAGGNAPDCAQQFPGGAGTLDSEGFNLIGDNEGCTFFNDTTGDQIGTPAAPIDPLVGPLANNGGPTPTHLPLAGSRAIDLANSSGCFSNDANNGSLLTVDQRSFTRPLDGDGDGGVRCDVGAVEVGCGNGVVETTEACDDGNTVAGDGCNACVLESCGDGTVQSPEGCDDGNTLDGDGCTANCILETCGNGTVDAGEQCDDGNSVNTDACLNTCRNAVCGDGFVETGDEECDDGNTNDGDGCSANCTDVILLVGDGGCSLIR
jgi:cysteine-rich repeat protein